MPKKTEKSKVNIKERVEDNVCDLSLSELSDVPVAQIASFKRVTVLDLSSNRLTTLKDNIVTLSRIVKLDLSKNQLTELPDDFGLLHNLRHLDLYDNKLEHLPLSFGHLTNLRYLDLKGNPLLPALAKIVGFCSTAKECHDAARNTVQFMATMQIEAEKAQELYQVEYELHQQQQQKQQQLQRNEPELQQMSNGKRFISAELVATDATMAQQLRQSNQNQYNQNFQQQQQHQHQPQQQKPKKSNKSKGNAKGKQGNHRQQQQQNVNINSKGIQTNPNDLQNQQQRHHQQQQRKNASSSKDNSNKKQQQQQSTALSSIIMFFILLAFNVLIIYLVMFKNPEIAEFIVNFIPQQYRNWLAEKTEIFRIRVTDWIMDFRTPPEEH